MTYTQGLAAFFILSIVIFVYVVLALVIVVKLLRKEIRIILEHTSTNTDLIVKVITEQKQVKHDLDENKK